jgi:putative membrane protein insertion efficiency factor
VLVFVAAGAFVENRAVRIVALYLIRFYQKLISPMLPASCRFYPSCSEYTYQAIEKYGILHGGWLGIRRVSRCHPWNPGGFDPVP